MPLISEETHSIPGLGWLSFLWLPSRRQTEQARKALVNSDEKEFVFAANPLAKAFVDGELNIGTMLRMDDRTLELKGVYPNAEYPAAMVFWDHPKGCYVQFTDFMGCREYEILGQLRTVFI